MSGVESRSLVGIDRETSRRNFLKTAAWAGAALSAAGIGGFGVAVRQANAQAAPYTTYEGLGDVAILQFAYLLEELEGDFYRRGVNAGLFRDDFLTQIATIRDHEFAHADALAATIEDLGAEVPAVPEFTYPPGTFTDVVAFLELAATFEPVGIGAYSGAAPALQSKDILAAAVSIFQVECEHRTAINILNLIVPPNDLAFQEALPLEDVQAAVEPFGVPV
jgi:hypothetical protein